MGYYDYKELREKAVRFGAQQEDIDALGKWFDKYGIDYWNGDYFDADDNYHLYPIYEELGNDCYEVNHYEFR